jgi:hypothetical protein
MPVRIDPLFGRHADERTRGDPGGVFALPDLRQSRNGSGDLVRAAGLKSHPLPQERPTLMTHSILADDTAAARAKLRAAEIENALAMLQATEHFAEALRDFAAAKIDYQKAHAELDQLAEDAPVDRLRLARAL